MLINNALQALLLNSVMKEETKYARARDKCAAYAPDKCFDSCLRQMSCYCFQQMICI